MDGDEEALERLMGFLVVTRARDDEENQYYRLRKGVNFIGRFGSRADVELRERECSEQHALLVCTNAATRLVDLDSTNGTKVEGEKTEFALLEDGYRITVGRTELVYVAFRTIADV